MKTKTFISELAPLIKEYLEFRSTLGYSNGHERYLLQFDAYCVENNLNGITGESVRGWINHEISQGHGELRHKASSVRALALYAGNGAYILPSKVLPKVQKKPLYIMTDDDLFRLFATSYNLSWNKGSSIKLAFPTILFLMYTCGLRPNEARLMKRNNINFTTGEILIDETKRHKERIVVMSDDMLEQCRKYDVIRAAVTTQSKYFFVREDGSYIPSYQLSKTFVRCWEMANPNVQLSLLPKLRPYDLRHRFASTIIQKWLNEGRDLSSMLPYLRAYMGHENLSDTAYYIHLLPENLLSSPGVDWNAIDDVNPEVSIWKS